MTVGMPASTRWPRQLEGCLSPCLEEACGALGLRLRSTGECGGWPVRRERPPRPERVDLITGENPVLGPDGCSGDPLVPYPNLGPGEDLMATVPVAVSDECDGTVRDEPVEVPVVGRDEKVEASQI